MQTSNVLEQPEYPNLPKCENDSVGSISRDEAIWLASIIDGEGCLQFRLRSKKEKRQMRKTLAIEIGNSSPYLIRRISEIWVKMGFHFFYCYTKTYKKDYMRILVGSQRGCQKVLTAILPHLVAKKEQATLILDYLNWRLNRFPIYGLGRNSRGIDEIRTKWAELESNLHRINSKRFSFQRLPRRASTVLDLTNLEVMVESSPPATEGV